MLIMGYGLSSDAWTPMLPLLTGFRAIVLDNRGTGSSDPPGEEFSIHSMAGDAVAVLDACEVDRAHVHGVSMGGMIAQALAIDHPERVASLVLGCTTPSPIRFMGDPESAVSLFGATVLAATDPDAGLDKLLPLVFSDEFIATNPSIRDLAKLLIGKGTVTQETALAMMRAMGDMSTGTMFDLTDRLSEIRVPTLVQHGTADRLVPVEAGRYLAAHIPGAEYQEFEGAGHAYGMERPLEAFPRMMQFLQAHSIAATASARGPSPGS
jgi:pimeloyl-ACP methyl ester carboxylesterase